ncbi:MAG: DNA polymerase IV [Pseudomonadota bacterium]
MIDNKLISSFCRKCYTSVPDGENKCIRCESRRIIRHKELSRLSIAHIDCDAFYAAIEKRDRPELADQPLIIGGGQRGVVSTACYIARTYGVKSAMPMFKALARCPHAVVIKPNMTKYAEVGREIRAMMQSLTPLVEPLSIDEAFLDMTGTERLHGGPPVRSLIKLQNEIAQKVGVTVSVGLSHNKFLAKVASDFDKPSGFFIIGRTETKEFLAQQPVTLIWGVGKAMARKLEQDGVASISDLQKMDQRTLAARYGEMGLRLFSLSRGEDARVVKPVRAVKSVSSETTFNTDISAPAELEKILWRLCEKVSARMKDKGLVGGVVTVKLKTEDFKTLTRRTTLETPSNLARVAFNAAAPLMRASLNGRAFRLVGVGYSALKPAGEVHHGDLFGDAHARIADQERAIDKIRAKFGEDAIASGRALKS